MTGNIVEVLAPVVLGGSELPNHFLALAIHRGQRSAHEVAEVQGDIPLERRTAFTATSL